MKRFLLVLTILFSLGPVLFPEGFILDPPPGTYSGTQNLVIRGTSRPGRYWFSESLDTSPVTYLYPLELTAYDGEERLYTVNIEGDTEGPYLYRIDRKPPAIPSASVESGVYGQDLYITLTYDKGDAIHYSLGTEESLGYRPWRGEPIHLPSPESGITEHVLKAYTVDSAGNRSSVAEYRYFIEADGAETEAAFTIRSPVTGAFADRQLLFIEHSGYEWIRFSIDGKNPISRGNEYTRPVLLDARGEVELAVAAKPEGREVPEIRRVRFTVQSDGSEAPVVPASGLYSESFTLRPPREGEFRYTLDDKSPRSWDIPFDRNLDLSVVENVRKVYTLRYRDFSSPEAPEYRKVYILDTVRPPAPRIVLFPREPRREEAGDSFDVIILNPLGTEIFYSLDGTVPGREDTEYTEPFVLTRDDDSGIDIRAVAFSDQGLPSETARYTRKADDLVPSSPEVAPLPEGDGFRLTSEEEGVRFVFTLSENPDIDPPAPDANAPICTDTFRYRVPYGMENQLRLRFAAVSESGRVSPPGEIFSLHLDRNPPDPPNIGFEGSRLIIEGGGTIHYSLSKEGKVHLPADLDGDIYEDPIELEGSEGKRVRYSVSARAVDDAGNSSETAGPVSFTIDRRNPEAPKIRGIADGEIVSRDTVVITWEPRYPDSIVLYTLATGDDDPDDPMRGSSRAEDWKLELPGTEGDVVTYTVSYRTMIPGAEMLSPVETVRFTVDRIPPGIPRPVGLTGDDSLTYGPVIDVEDREEGVEYYVGIGTDTGEIPDCFGPEGRSLATPFVLDVPEGNEKEFILRFAARDAGGNTVYNETLYRLEVDRNPPPAPTPFPKSLIYTPEDISIASPGDGTDYLYGFGDLSREGGEVGRFRTIEEELLLRAEDGKVREYVISLKARDRAGNVSPETSIYRVVVDKDPPMKCALQYSLTEMGAEGYLLEWYGRGENELYYSFDGEDDFRRYTGPVEISEQLLSEDTPLREISVYLVDPAGNRGETNRIVLVQSPRELPAPRISGVEDGGLYAEEVRLEVDPVHGIARYELSEGTETKQVGPHSPRFSEPLEVDVVPGETKTYTLAVRSYLSETGDAGGPLDSVRFTIDRTPPDPPEISGAVQGGYYGREVEIALSAPEGSIFYSVEGSHRENADGAEDGYALYDGPITFGPGESGAARFTISAYTEDEAGNRSYTGKSLEFFIDTAILYVSKERGNDSYEGSRERPFETLEGALTYPREGGRRTVFMSEGSYEIDETIRPGKGSHLIGGFDPGTWTRRGMTRIVPGKFFPEGEPLVGADTDCSLENIVLEDPTVRTGALVAVRQGALELLECSLVTDRDYTGTAVVLDEGSLRGRGVDLDLGADGDETGIRLRGKSVLEISFSDFINTSEKRGLKTMVRSDPGGTVILANTRIRTGGGRETRGVDVTDSTLEMRSVEIDSGAGASESTAIRTAGSDIHLSNCTLLGKGSSALTFGVRSTGSSLTIEETLVRLDAEIGATGIYAIGGTLEILDCTFDHPEESPADFLSAVKVDSVKGHIFNSILSVDTDADCIAVDLVSSAVEFYNNTGILSLGSGRSSALRIRGDRGSSIINNIFAAPSAGESPAILSDGSAVEKAEIRNNCFSGWPFILESDPGKIDTVEELNRLDNDPRGGPIGANLREDYGSIFKVTKGGGYKLLPSSRCVDSGLDLGERGGPVVDRAGRDRPNPNGGFGPAWDIGAFESY